MKIEFTPAQQLAIDTNGGLLVAAAAGSGKTAVLAERVIRHLCDTENPISADRLLIVTFTNAAAAEMRRRIEKRLFEECAKHPENRNLIRQKRLISSAKICTIDSFCIDLVRQNFEKCGVNPDFKISTGSDLAEIDKRVMSEIILEKLEENSPEFLRLLQLMNCYFNEENLTSRIVDTYDYSMQTPFPKSYLDGLTAPYEIPFDINHPWHIAAFDEADEQLSRLEGIPDAMLEAASLIEGNNDEAIAYAEAVGFVVQALNTACKNRDWDTFCATLSASGTPSIRLSKSDPATNPIRDGRALLDGVKKKIHPLFCEDTAGIEAMIKDVYPAARLFVQMTKEYADRIFEEYRKENVLTFAQTEQLALSLLCDEREGEIVAREGVESILSRFDEVMVDEFQDVNDLQNLLFEMLSGRGERLFVVGDVKQSIYGFRGSNPANFLNKKNSYIPIDSSAFEDKKKIVLSDNFRSHRGVCDFVNFFFVNLLNGQTGELVYNDEEKLTASAKFPQSGPEAVEVVITSNNDDPEIPILKREAEAIADYIEKTVKEPPFIRDGDGVRAACYSDFAILLSAMKDKASVISRELKDRGIPIAFSPETFFDSVEIKTFMSLLWAIDNPRRDVELLTVMLSPMVGFTANKVANIRMCSRNSALYSSVIAAERQGDAEAKSFLEWLAALRRSASLMSVENLVSQLLDQTDYLNIVTAMSGGSARRSNLLTLLKLARQYTQNGKTGIAGFLRMLEAMPEDFAGADSTSDGVKIMSMHASKGLQFPICMVSNLHGRLNFTDSREPVLRSERFGLGISYKDELSDSTVNTLPHRLIAAENKVFTIDERLRLLYVAMTRAEDRLVLFSGNEDLSASLERIGAELGEGKQRISATWLKSTITMNDWILAALLMHPDGQRLRALSGLDITPETTEHHIKISFFKGYSESEIKEEQSDTDVADLELVSALEKNFRFEYPNKTLCDIGIKASVSELAKAEENDFFAYSERPAFMEKGGLSAAEKGTAAHKVMQFIDMSGKPDVDSEIERLCEYRFISENEAAAVDRATIKRFFESNLFDRINKSDDVRREMRFLTEVPISFVKEDAEMPEANVIIQGEIDLCFVENGEVVVVDFKTDRVGDMEPLKQRYQKQLDIYAMACEKIFELPVKQRIIYSLHLSKETAI